VSSEEETAVCNLGSVNLMRHFDENGFDFIKLKNTVKTAIRQLNRVIDVTFYPINQAKNSNFKWRPIGLGIMGLADVFFKAKIPFDSAEAKSISQKIMEEIYFSALETSAELAQEEGAHETFNETRASLGVLQCDLWDHEPIDKKRYESVKNLIRINGLRNSLLIAIAPTATIASIVGCYECIEPQVSNIYRSTSI
jgi:ribonucleoside-diphosphate reductase alpha chain